MANAEFIVDVTSLVLYITTLVVTSLIVILTYIHQRPILKNIYLLSTFNTYFSIIAYFCSVIILYSHTMYGNLHPTVNFHSTWCFVQYHLVFISISNVYYSYCVQALIRLFRIKFYQIKILQPFPFIILMIVIQWFVGFVTNTPMIFADFVQYIEIDHVCYIPFDNIRGYICTIGLLYSIPITLVLIIYGFIIRHTRRTIHVRQTRAAANNRDTTVLKRILIVIFVSMLFALPLSAVLLFYWITHQLVPMAYRIQVLCAALSMFLQSVALAYVTPQIRETFQRHKMRTVHLRATEIPIIQINPK